MTVITLLDITPPERYDSVAWMAWHIEEGSVEPGPFVEIDNKPLTPIDPDPRYPAARDLTTDNGSAEGMWYRVRFRDVNNQFSSYSAPIHNAPSVDLPNIRQVALHIRSRTITRNTNEFRGTFTHETRPTADEAAEAVEIARDDVLTDVGKLPDGLQAEAYAAVRSLIALRAAMIIERSYYPEQVGTDKSPYPALRDDYNDRLPRVIEAVAEAETTPPGEIKPGDVLQTSPTSGGGSGPADKIAPYASRVYTGTLFVGTATPQYTLPDDPDAIDMGTKF